MNDEMRRSLIGCHIDMSVKVRDSGFSEDILDAVRSYECFAEHKNKDDPHDFGVIFLNEEFTIFWFLEKTRKPEGSDDKSGHEHTLRIMFDHEL